MRRRSDSERMNKELACGVDALNYVPKLDGDSYEPPDSIIRKACKKSADAEEATIRATVTHQAFPGVVGGGLKFSRYCSRLSLRISN